MSLTIKKWMQPSPMMKLLPSLESTFPNFKQIWMLRQHFERALQRLPCPQSIQHGWKGMVMARELYALLTTSPFCLPTNPGAAAVCVRSQIPGQPVNNDPVIKDRTGIT